MAASPGQFVSLPAVHIGTYKTSTTTSILLQMVATLHHTSLLAHAMSDLTANLEAAFYAHQMSFIAPTSGADEKTCKEIRIRASGFHDQVKSIKYMLSHIGLI
ncbi:hypothetical protein BKA67DRAFT_657939 [Truncatella angustata]|uniref:Uncharacterized protein n=1 Tax=Truncatella angustata TaxID=152316 RepID=A0A9P8ZZC4_9PEZI|nr:uncharacterized protein BKA67DRAFT_657939 [Truncatella angustata]KAH6656047.1 hypothetical protein BKA67DRAFT_657939 [Truncatella angustata]